MNWLPFFSYVFLTTFTPGANNIMAMSNAAKNGFHKGLRFCFGVLLGFFIVMFFCALSCSALLDFFPGFDRFMSYIGAVYIIWLAWSLFRPGSSSRKRKGTTFLSAVFLQFINVKVIMYGITAMSVFLLPYYGKFYELVFWGLALSFVGFLSTCCWALFGAVFEKVFNRYHKLLNVIMALLLIYTALSQLFAR